MDCGPVCLATVLAGFGRPVPLETLRDLCRTQVDGTSIDDLEVAAGVLGLSAEQVLVPVDHLAIPAARLLPAIVVVRTAEGLAHFVVVWRRIGRHLQIMDPEVGRRFVPIDRFLREVWVHELEVPANDWREWGASDDFLVPLRHRAREVGGEAAGRWVEDALADPGWRSLGALDSAVRFAEDLRAGGALHTRAEAGRLVDRLRSGSRGMPREEGTPHQSISNGPKEPQEDDAAAPAVVLGSSGLRIPATHCFVEAGSDESVVRLRGAILVRFPVPPEVGIDPDSNGDAVHHESSQAGPWGRAPRWFGRVIAEIPPSSRVALAVGAFVATLVGFAQVLLLRALLDPGGPVATPFGRTAAIGIVFLLSLLVLLLDLTLLQAAQAWGRRTELRLRALLAAKQARLDDAYFRTRLLSDLIERLHRLSHLHALPELFLDLGRIGASLLLAVAVLVWLAPAQAGWALLAGAVGVGIPLLAQPWLGELDLRLRAHSAGLARFYTDAILGSMVVRAHGGAEAVRREHEARTAQWARASFASLRAGVTVQALAATLATTACGLLLWRHVASGQGAANGVLLIAYWAVQIPLLADRFTTLLRTLPQSRSVVLRAQEALDAQDDPGHVGDPATQQHSEGGVRSTRPVDIEVRDVSVQLGGSIVLSGLSLRCAPGSRTALVGPSGSGKSTLIALLLGLYRPASGGVSVDGHPLTAARLLDLRRRTAWIDPQVHLFDRSLAGNAAFGALHADAHTITDALSAAHLDDLLRQLPPGDQAHTGEGGVAISGGEGQRLRFARAFSRPGADLLLLDEAGRGLDPGLRRELRRELRRRFPGATWIEATHDPEDIDADFDAVGVLMEGRLVEFGAPAELARRGGPFARWLADADELHRTIWSDPSWQVLGMHGGRLHASGANEATPTASQAESWTDEAPSGRTGAESWTDEASPGRTGAES